MHQVLASLHVLGLQVGDHVRARVAGDHERGNVTMEQVLWAVAVIAIVAIVTGAVTKFVTAEAGKIGQGG